MIHEIFQRSRLNTLVMYDYISGIRLVFVCFDILPDHQKETCRQEQFPHRIFHVIIFLLLKAANKLATSNMDTWIVV